MSQVGTELTTIGASCFSDCELEALLISRNIIFIHKTGLSEDYIQSVVVHPDNRNSKIICGLFVEIFESFAITIFGSSCFGAIASSCKVTFEDES